MKKCTLFIFIIFFCFHDAFEHREAADLKMNPRSVTVLCQSHFDDVFEMPADNYLPVSPVNCIIAESALNLPNENYATIWKPPVISLL
jgi:hypothetical protein